MQMLIQTTNKRREERELSAKPTDLAKFMKGVCKKLKALGKWIISIFKRHRPAIEQQAAPKKDVLDVLMSNAVAKAMAPTKEEVAAKISAYRIELNQKLTERAAVEQAKSYELEKSGSVEQQKMFVEINANFVADTYSPTDTRKADIRCMRAVHEAVIEGNRSSLNADLASALTSTAAFSRYEDIRNRFDIDMSVIDRNALCSIDLGTDYAERSIDPELIKQIPTYTFVINGSLIRKHDLLAALQIRSVNEYVADLKK